MLHIIEENILKAAYAFPDFLAFFSGTIYKISQATHQQIGKSHEVKNPVINTFSGTGIGITF